MKVYCMVRVVVRVDLLVCVGMLVSMCGHTG